MKNLDDIEKNNNFKVPENYFEDFEKQLNNYIDSRISKQIKVSVFQKIKPYIYFVACFLSLFFIGKIIIEFALEKTQKPLKIIINNNQPIEKNNIQTIDIEYIDTYDYLSFQQNIEYELTN